MMRMIVDIDEDDYKHMVSNFPELFWSGRVKKAILNGILLSDVIKQIESKIETEAAGGVDHLAKIAHNCGINEAINILKEGE